MRAIGLILILGLSLVDGGLEGKKAGPFDIKLRSYQPCPEKNSGLNTFRLVNTTLNAYNRTMVTLNGDLFVDEELSDKIVVGLYFSQFTSGGIKENFLNQELGPACSSMKGFAPEVFKSLMKDVFQAEECPVGKGVYHLKDFPLTFGTGGNLPGTFFYGHYYVDLIFKHASQVKGCFRLVSDIVKKQRKRG